MAATEELKKKTFLAKITILGKPGGGGEGGDGGDGEDGNGEDGNGNGGGGEGGDGGGKPVPPGGWEGKKPRGYRTMAFDPDEAPADPPTPPGEWVVINAGRGKPPVFGFVADDWGLEGGNGNGEEDGDNGDSGDKPPVTPAGGQAQSKAKPKPKAEDDNGDDDGEKKGHYVAIQSRIKEPRRSEEKRFAWIPHIEEGFGVKHTEDGGNGNGNGEEKD